MSYVDYSNNFVLDQFFTYINVNQLGANDKHIVDNFSVEHNWNASSANGTHKNSSIIGSYISKNPTTTGSQSISMETYWTPTVGIYQIVKTYDPEHINTKFEIYVSGSWETPAGSGYNFAGLFFCDGTNMRFRNSNAGSGITLTYQKF